MSVPKKRRTPSSQGNRRSHHALGKIKVNKCPKCSGPIQPHRACSTCGTYKGREVIKIKSKTKKASS